MLPHIMHRPPAASWQCSDCQAVIAVQYGSAVMVRVVLRWNCAKVIANIDDLAISIWAPKVIDELSQIDDI